MLDHVAVTRIPGSERQVGAYQLRAELQDPPPADWLARFQNAWYGSPNCRRLCSTLKADGSSIYLRVLDSTQVGETVCELRSLISQTDHPSGNFQT